ncbi:MAG: response regulator transcription factor [Xenococcus sp. MO_188.B8]|nr:response regulator transcription factor [Xenococcus sp. MO_188.B8]
MTLSLPIKIMIVDNHALLREGIHYLCLTTSNLTLVGEAANGKDALELCYELQPDLVLMDLMMPGMDGIATTKAIREQCPEIKILILTSFITQDLVRQAIAAGANSFVLKDASTEEIINAIRLTYHGLTIMSPDVTEILAAPPPSDVIFTPRQLQVLKLMIQGLNNTQIGKALSISTYTARFHVSEILSKLGVSNRTEAVSVALSRKIVQSQDM